MKVSGFILAPKFRKVQEKGEAARARKVIEPTLLSLVGQLSVSENFEILKSEKMPGGQTYANRL